MEGCDSFCMLEALLYSVRSSLIHGQSFVVKNSRPPDMETFARPSMRSHSVERDQPASPITRPLCDSDCRTVCNVVQSETTLCRDLGPYSMYSTRRVECIHTHTVTRPLLLRVAGIGKGI